jgi:ectoine hydroxylase-related dioxygenase (phytanoyl-CoA dioxygenase family)
MTPTNIKASELTEPVFMRALEGNGYLVVEGLIAPDLLERGRADLDWAIAKEAEFHKSIEYQGYGMLIACPIYGKSFLEFADHAALMQPFNWVLNDTCIIYVYTSSSLPPGKSNFATRIHVDRPHFIPGYTESLGCLILLDDFTEENGATWVLPGSHKVSQQPSEEYFYQHASRIIAPKGSVFYFHLRLWHAGGVNNTNHWRHALGIGMVRGHLKQRIDLPRAMKDVDISGLSDFGLQKLGFLSQPPVSLEEYYAPADKRPFRQRSEWENEDQRG